MVKKQRVYFFISLMLVVFCFAKASSTSFLIKLTGKESNSLSKEQLKNNLLKDSITIDTIGVYGIAQLLKNETEKLRVINIWATWCGSCVSEFPDFVALNKIYRNDAYEWITISADEPRIQNKVLKFLKKHEGFASNYLFNSEDKFQLIAAIDPNWRGAIPYTMVVEPAGKILYAQQGVIDPAELKKIIEGSGVFRKNN